MTLDQFYAELRKVTEGGVKWNVVNGFIEPVGSRTTPWIMVHGSQEMSAEDQIAVRLAANLERDYSPAIRAKLLEICGLEERE